MKSSDKSSILKNKIAILSGFFTVLILLAVLMTIAMTRIETNKVQINTITTDLANVKNVQIMRSAAQNRALILYRMAQTKDAFERDDMYMQFSDNASIFLRSSSKISKNLYRQSEIDFYKKSKETIKIGATIQNQTAINIIDGEIEFALTTLTEKIIPIQQDVTQQLKILTLSLQNHADNEILKIAKANDDANFLIGIIGGIAILLGIAITFYVTRRVTKSENDLIEQRLLAENANKAKSMFLATMSHEIRSPLTAIIGFSNSMRDPTISQSRADLCVESIHRNSKHLLHLINDILDITKIEAGQLDIEQINVSPFAVLDEIQSAILVAATEKGLSFKINYAFPLPEKVLTDKVRLKQILINLISNAIKFTEKGGINVNVSCDKNNQIMTFDVIDTGIGLSAKQQDKIFESFTQADSSTTRQYGGSGLGLNICKQLANKLGGAISVGSTVGRGSKFSFTIATSDISDDSLVYSLDHHSTVEEHKAVSPSQKLYGHVLLAEDTIDNQNLIEMYVTDTGAQITIVENGAEAVKITELKKFDLILMDMQMPVMDGITATQQIRVNDTNTPIITLTANAMKSDYERCIDAGANEFLTKPIDLIRFNQVLYKYLSSSKENKKTQQVVNKLQKLTEKFIIDLPTRMAKIVELKEQQAWQSLEEETHKLKALGTPFGFPEITEMSDKINLHCRNKHYRDAEAMVNDLNAFCSNIE